MDERSTLRHESRSEFLLRRYLDTLSPLWIWLAIAFLVMFFAMPADPMTVLIVSGYGLFSFVFGAVLATSLHLVLRVLPLVAFAAFAAWIFVSSDDRLFSLVTVSYGIASIAMGYWGWRKINDIQILVSFCAGYLVGSLFGFFGSIAGGIVGAGLGVRSSRTQSGPDAR